MTKLGTWKVASLVFAFGVVTTVAAEAQNFAKLVDFDSTNGAAPVYTGLIQGPDGDLYGTTLGGGTSFVGTVFKITPAGNLTTLYSFCIQNDCTDGSSPQAGLTLANDGNFYGATFQGGANGDGTIFKISSRGQLTVLHSFNLADGSQPFAPPVQASDGNFYGTTNVGGVTNSGTVFKMTPKGVLTTLHSFDGSDGMFPLGTLVQGSDGALYGTTELGGPDQCGSVFRITKAGSFTNLHSFDCSDGSYPFSGLIQATDGKLYGTTISGGNNTCNGGCGTLFAINRNGTFTTIYDFDDIHGSNPIAALIQGSDGSLYGTTFAGGADGWGTIFTLSHNGVLTTLHSFDSNDGAQPFGALVQATTGNYYGTTQNGGDDNLGTVFGLSDGQGPFVAFVHNQAKGGQRFGILGQGLRETVTVLLNGTPTSFIAKSNTFLIATVPAGATTGYVTVTTPSGTLTSNVPFHVIK